MSSIDLFGTRTSFTNKRILMLVAAAETQRSGFFGIIRPFAQQAGERDIDG